MFGSKLNFWIKSLFPQQSALEIPLYKICAKVFTAAKTAVQALFEEAISLHWCNDVYQRVRQ